MLMSDIGNLRKVRKTEKKKTEIARKKGKMVVRNPWLRDFQAKLVEIRRKITYNTDNNSD